MYAPFQYGIIALSVVLFATLLIPIAVLLNDITNNPYCLTLSITPQQVITNETIVIEATITINYCSPIPLKDFKIYLADKVIEIPKLTKGTHQVNITIHVQDTINISSLLKRIEFSIYDIYTISIEVKQ